MGANPERFYWDTSVFLCFLWEGEKDRRLICESILKHAQQGDVQIITSMYTLVEVIRPRQMKHPHPLTNQQVATLEGMFKWPFIKKIQVHEDLAFKAARLARECGLKPADAIHAATAINAHVDELQAWDSDYSKVSHLVKVAAPDYLHNKGPLFSATNVGPTPADFPAPPQPGSSPVAPPRPRSEK